MSLSDVDLAAGIADTAGKLLLELRASGLFEGKALGKAGDGIANAFIMAALREHRPDDAILSEEEQDNQNRCAQSRAWIVDPLDGTREYAEGRDDWAVHIALSVDCKPALGVVALPAQGKLLRSDAPPSAPHCPQRLRLLVSRTRPPAEAERVAKALGAELVPMGSAGAKAMSVLLGHGDVYLHAGGQYEWDNCAPAAVALAAGLHAARLDGSPLAYNQRDPKLPDLLICRPEHAERVAKALAGPDAPGGDR